MASITAMCVPEHINAFPIQVTATAFPYTPDLVQIGAGVHSTTPTVGSDLSALQLFDLQNWVDLSLSFTQFGTGFNGKLYYTNQSALSSGDVFWVCLFVLGFGSGQPVLAVSGPWGVA